MSRDDSGQDDSDLDKSGGIRQLAAASWPLPSSLGLTVVGRAEADRPHPELLGPRMRTLVRYADPAAWITAAAIARLLAPPQRQLVREGDGIGLIVVSDDGPQNTMKVVAEAARAMQSSPLRYPAALPCSLAGVSCIAHGLRGPTLTVILPPARGVPTALIVAAGWLQRQFVPYVVVAVFARGSSEAPLARCVLLSAGSSTTVPGAPLSDRDAAWLSLSAVRGSAAS